MTLAIVTIFEDQAFMLSDIKLSYDLEVNDGFLAQPQTGLKIFFLASNVAAAYAGTSELAHSYLQAAQKSLAKSVPLPEVLQQLRTHCSGSDEVDLLIVDARPPVKIYKITSNTWSSSTNGTFWIGDSDAANQLLREGVPPPSKLDGAFQALLDSKAYPSVGGTVVVAYTKDGFAKFVPKMCLHSPFRNGPPPQGWNSVDWGDAARGGFGYTTLTPTDPSRNGWGLHFFQGNCGYFFKVELENLNFERLVWRNSTVDSAIKALNVDLGFDVELCGRLGS